MLEKHYCAHLLLPGYVHPSSEGIRCWAVMQMHKFCFKHGLREKLSARSHEQIPVLKMTMILENHWRCIKHDFLHHFHLLCCDFLAWILVVKLAPSYYRKDFKRMWKKLGKKPITLPVNPAYKTDTKKLACTCPSQSTNHFLLCKHIDTAGDALSESHARVTEVSGSLERAGDGDEDDSGDEGDDEEEEDMFVDMQKADEENLTSEEMLDQHVDTIIGFANRLKYQRRFRDQRMLQTLERDGGAFLWLARACLTKKKRLKST
ncbi:hypothetical protein B0H14DRAFT_3509325 [Mycena olivaceomarginata]|nr:hypothetical protein B0H14DRAFT_3509325 [Mycena olivaceomarginata]